MQQRRLAGRTVGAIGLGGMPLSVGERPDPQRVVPIPGASRPGSIMDSAAAAELVLTDEELARLDAVV